MNAKHRIRSVIAITIILTMLFAPVSVSAASGGKPYKDVSKKTVTADQLTAIKYIKSRGGYKKISIKKKKFKPNKKITRREVIIVLTGLYPSHEIPVKATDVINANKIATYDWLYSKLSDLGLDLTGERPEVWDKQKGKLTRAKVSMVIANFDVALRSYFPDIVP